MNELEALNRTMFLHINGSDDTPAWLIQVAIGMANYLIYLMPLLVLGLWLWGDHVRRLGAHFPEGAFSARYGGKYCRCKRSLRYHFAGMAHDC